jgi:hypothetical protein
MGKLTVRTKKSDIKAQIDVESSLVISSGKDHRLSSFGNGISFFPDAVNTRLKCSNKDNIWWSLQFH